MIAHYCSCGHLCSGAERERRPLPTYPGAVVMAGRKVAIRGAMPSGSWKPWRPLQGRQPWMSDAEVLRWLGPGWRELSVPPAGWVEVDPRSIEDGDRVRYEFPEGVNAVEGIVETTSGHIKLNLFGLELSIHESGRWFKCEEKTDASE